MTPSKRAVKEADDPSLQQCKISAAAALNLTEMTSNVLIIEDDEPEGSGEPSTTIAVPVVAAKRCALSKEEELSTKKIKVSSKDTSVEGTNRISIAKVDIEDEFARVVKSKFFDDRTLIISDFVNNENQWVVDNKPHRFGKTTNVYAIVLYLSRFFPLKNEKLFDLLRINDVPNFKNNYFKTCSVFYLNLSVNENENVFQAVLQSFKNCFESITKYVPTYREEFDPEHPRMSLTNLMGFLEGLRVAVIDEYDSALLELYDVFTNGSEDDKERARFYANEIYGFLNVGHSTHQCRFFITGIVTMRYTDLFSDHRMIFTQVISVYNKPFRQYHMTTMENFLKLNGFDSPPNEETQEKLKLWYGGYTYVENFNVFGNLLNLYSLKQYYFHEEFKPYFNTSGCTPWLRKFFQREDVILFINEVLFEKDDIVIELECQPFFSGRNNVLSLLVHCGYLVLVSNLNQRFQYNVKIPNEETREVFIALVKCSFANYLPSIDTGGIRMKLYNAFVTGSEDVMRAALQEFYAAVQGNIRYEETHCFLLQIALMDFKSITYLLFNSAAGSGLCDGVILCKKKGYVVEFKIAPLKELPVPKTTAPVDYDNFCIEKSNELLRIAENQHINQEYINCLKAHNEITEKYRLLIACVQKRAFIKLKKVDI